LGKKPGSINEGKLSGIQAGLVQPDEGFRSGAVLACSGEIRGIASQSSATSEIIAFTPMLLKTFI
jgi:hypothetical protein